MSQENHQEIEELTSIKESRAFYNLLAERKEYLQKGVNSAIREQNLIKAYGELAKLDDLKKLMQVITARITRLGA